jgi:hypothetical protein
MGDGFIRWYRESGKYSAFSDQVAAFERCGVTLTHPGIGAPTVINVDGDDVAVDLEMLKWVVELRIPSLTVNWWTSPDANVVGTYSHEPLGCEVQTFWLDGLNIAEMEILESAVMSAISRVPTPTRALVCDVQGATDADDWDSVILYEGTEIPGSVDSLLVSPSAADQLISASRFLHSERLRNGLTKIITT